MEFETKKALLEYLGKDSNDRKLVDRMMARWEVRMKDWMYILVDKDSIIHELEEEIKRLKSEPKQVVESDSWEIQKLKEELEDAKINCDYWKEKCYRYADYLEKVISVTYDRIKPVLWNKLEEKSDFREHILEEVREISKYKE